MAVFKEVKTFVEFPKIEKKVLKFWEKEDVYHKLRDNRKENEKFIFLEGPPTTKG